MTKLTREQAAIIGAFTGVSCGPFSDVHKKIEELLDRPVFTHEIANSELWEKVKEKVKPEFFSICAEEKHDTR
jgi:hypothetical protein